MSNFELQTFELSISILHKLPKHPIPNTKLFELFSSKLEFISDKQNQKLGIFLLDLFKNYTFQFKYDKNVTNSNLMIHNIYYFLNNFKGYIQFEKNVVLLIILIQFSIQKQLFTELLEVPNEDELVTIFPEYFRNNLKMINLLFKFFVRQKKL